MPKLSRDDVIRIVGDLDDLVVARIVATGATAAELREAAAAVKVEDEEGETAAEPSTARVAALRGILEDVFDEDLAEPE